MRELNAVELDQVNGGTDVVILGSYAPPVVTGSSIAYIEISGNVAALPPRPKPATDF